MERREDREEEEVKEGQEKGEEEGEEEGEERRGEKRRNLQVYPHCSVGEGAHPQRLRTSIQSLGPTGREDRNNSYKLSFNLHICFMTHRQISK